MLGDRAVYVVWIRGVGGERGEEMRRHEEKIEFRIEKPGVHEI